MFNSFLRKHILSKTYILGLVSGLLLGLLVQMCPRTNKSYDSVDQYKSKAENRSEVGRILCWVLTSPQNKFKAEMIKATWGQKCDKLLFMSSQNDGSLPAVGLPITKESRSQLWNKVKLALRYIYDHHLNDFDWFLKADDDTFVVVENLRQFTSTWNASLPLFLGRKFYFGSIPLLRSTYHSGGAGYLLTRESIRLFVEEGLDKDKCQIKSDDFEDVNIGQCLKNVGVQIGDSRDQFGRQRFIPYHVEEFYSGKGGNMDFLRQHDPDGLKLGNECCSDEAVTFHYISGHQMQVYQYLLYTLKIANVTRM